MNTGKNQFSGSSQRGPAKPTQDAAAIAFLGNPSMKAGAAPSHEEIMMRAYEIWLSVGQVAGHDQDHWFQAEQELRTVQKAGGPTRRTS